MRFKAAGGRFSSCRPRAAADAGHAWGEHYMAACGRPTGGHSQFEGPPHPGRETDLVAAMRGAAGAPHGRW